MDNKKVDPLVVISTVCSVLTIVASTTAAIVGPALRKKEIAEEVAKAMANLNND